MPEFSHERRHRLRTLRMMVSAGSWTHESYLHRYETKRFDVESMGKRVARTYDRDHAAYVAELHNEFPDLLDALDAADAEVASLRAVLAGLLNGDAVEQAWRAAQAALETPTGSEFARRQAELEARVREQEDQKRLLAGLSEEQRADLVRLAADVDALRVKTQRQETRIRGLDKAQNELKRQRGELVAALKVSVTALHGLPGSGSLLWTQIQQAEAQAAETLARAEVVYGA